MEQRTRELGIRLALGAHGGDVIALVARETAPMVLTGLLIGLAIAAAMSRFARSMLYGIEAADPVTFAAVPLVLAAVALVAAILPARRAARVDPATVLRDG
jgi:ABC-type antimicrobial peptide transport system permease subunit